MLPSNFFERQAHAKTRTTYLIFLFVVALLATIASVTFIVLAAIHLRNPPTALQLFHDPRYYLIVGGGLSFAIGLASFLRISELKASGGRGILKGFNHRIIEANSANEKDRLLRNVVEEMSIASGVPMPTVAVIEDEIAINAFAAGFHDKDSVIAVSEGTLQQLSRDELQGVIAHEFSHLLNKDSATNIKITGAIYGLLVLTILGRVLMQTRVSGRDRNNGGAVVILVGMVIFVVGGIGKLFSSLIQAAVSRQREFLADASAVQFTRNPLGLGGALVKIAGLPQKTFVAAKATELNHFFFFSNPRSLFSTHPPLDQRIKAVAPQLLSAEVLREIQTDTPIALDTASGTNPFFAANGAIAKFSPALKSASESHRSVPALLASIFLSSDPTFLEKQSLVVAQIFSKDILREAMNLARDVSYADQRTRYLLVEKSLSEIHRTPLDQNRRLVEMIRQLIMLDKNVSFFEMLIWMLVVDAASLRSAYQPVRAQKPSENYQEVVLMLRLLNDVASLGSDKALEQALKIYWPQGPGYIAALQRNRIDALPVERIGEAIEELKFSSEALRRSFMQSALKLASADGKIEANEWLLLRALGILLECPVPLPESP